MLKLTIPRIPVGPNGPRGLFRMHWSARRRDRQEWTLEIAAAVRAAPGAPEFCATGFRNVTIHQVRRRRLDHDNLHASCKHVLDALVSAGLIVDDSPGWITLIVTQEAGKPNRTEITITEESRRD